MIAQGASPGFEGAQASPGRGVRSLRRTTALLRLTVAHMTFLKIIFSNSPKQITNPVAQPGKKLADSRNTTGLYGGRIPRAFCKRG